MSILYNQLKQLGVPENIAKIYAALLGKREMSALDIHESAGVPRSNMDDIAQKMIQRRCVSRKTLDAAGSEPCRILDHLMMVDRAEHSRKKKTVEVMTSVFSALKGRVAEYGKL